MVGLLLGAGALVAVVGIVVSSAGPGDEVALSRAVVAGEFAELDEEVACARATGCVRWVRELDDAWSYPVQLLRVDALVITATDTELRAWDLATGDARWVRELAPDTRRGAGVLPAGEGLLAVPTTTGLHLLTGVDGERVAAMTLPGRLQAAVVDGDRLRVAWLRRDEAGSEVDTDPDASATAADDGDRSASTQPVDAPRWGVGVYDLATGEWRWRRDLAAHALEPAIVAGDEEVLHVLDPDTGRADWSREGVPGRLSIVGDALALQADEEVELRALADGALRARLRGSLRPTLAPWSDDGSLPATEPLLVVDVDGQRAVDARGEVLWERASEFEDGVRAPVRFSRIGQGLLHVHGRAGEDGQPLLDLATGDETARVPDDVVTGSAPTALRAATATTVVGEALGETVAYDLEHDRELWRVTRAGPRGQSVLDDEHGIAVVTGPSRLVGLEVP